MIKKKIGLLLDSHTVSKQIFDFIRISDSSENYVITTLIVNSNDRNSNNLLIKIFNYIRFRGFNKLLYSIAFKLLCKVESKIIKRYKRFEKFYQKYELPKSSFEIIEVSPIISKSGLLFKYSKIDLERIKEANLELIVRTGKGILSGDILNICPNGVISFHHADNNINRGGPPGFWEVFYGFSKTGFIIQRLNEELDGGNVFTRIYFYKLVL